MTDSAALCRFEALVLSQQPASVPWAPVTDYSAEARRQIEGRHPDIIVEAFKPKRTLDVGCGPGHLIALLRERGVDAVGVDKSANPYRRFTHIRQGDIATCGYQIVRRWKGPYELVICREVLEHLTIREVARAVRNLCELSSRYVYVTTRFHLKPDHLLDVMTSDDLDPTHITLLNQDFLRTLFVLEGFKRRADLETKLDWLKKGRVLVYERA
jgi:SAM-dependent methyltransferase